MNTTYVFPPIHESILDNGLRVLLVPDTEQDGLVVAAQFRLGTFSDPVGLEGTAELCMGLIQKGSGELSAEQTAEKLEFAGASLFSDVGEEHLGLGIRMLCQKEEEILPVFWNMLLNPRFEQHEFTRIQREMVTSLQAETVDPGIIANRYFYRTLAGKDHPAGRFYTLNSVKKTGISDVKNFYETFFLPQNCILVVAGNFDPEKFRNRWFDILSKWTGISETKPVYALPVQVPSRVVKLIDKPTLTQASIMIGHAAPGELFAHRNEVALSNYILGAGNFSSRLMSRVRSADGKTYGISSQIASERQFGAFSITTSTQNSQLGGVLKSILEVLDDFCKNGVSDSELEKAKQFVTGNMAFQLEGIGNIAEKLLWLRFYDRPNSYIENFDSIIDQITLEGVNQAIRDHFSVENLIIVVVGKKVELLPQLKEFGLLSVYHFRDKI